MMHLPHSEPEWHRGSPSGGRMVLAACGLFVPADQCLRAALVWEKSMEHVMVTRFVNPSAKRCYPDKKVCAACKAVHVEAQLSS